MEWKTRRRKPQKEWIMKNRMAEKGRLQSSTQVKDHLVGKREDQKQKQQEKRTVHVKKHLVTCKLKPSPGMCACYFWWASISIQYVITQTVRQIDRERNKREKERNIEEGKRDRECSVHNSIFLCENSNTRHHQSLLGGKTRKLGETWTATPAGEPSQKKRR